MSNNGTEGINPAWQEILNSVPAEFHNQLIPTLKKWDAGVQQKFTDIRAEFDELKPFESFVKNNVDPQYVEQAVMLADQLQRDPNTVINRVNEAWNLGYVSKDEAEKLGQSAGESTDGDGDFTTDDDILKNPKVKAMQDALNQLQEGFQSQQEKDEEARELAEFETYLDTLETKTTEANLPFHRTFVTALISQGMDGEAAVKQYHQVLAGNVVKDDTTETNTTETNTTPPNVMGSEGSTGSGSADGSVDFGSLSKNNLNATIEQMLAQQAQSGQ